MAGPSTELRPNARGRGSVQATDEVDPQTIDLAVRPAVIDLTDEQPPTRRAPSRLFWWTNVFNLADAGLTAVVLGKGMALEANPVIGVIGLPGKIALVGVASYALDRLKPRALWIPAIALGAVVTYTLFNLVARI